MSKQKKLITEILAASYAHPTASQIFEEARKKMPNIALDPIEYFAVDGNVLYHSALVADDVPMGVVGKVEAVGLTRDR